MQKVVLISMEEYNDLIQIQKEPDVILQKTVENYKEKLDEAYKIIAEQDRTLKTYAVGGMKPRNIIEDDVVINAKSSTQSQLDVVIKASQFKNHPNNIATIAKACNCSKTTVLKRARALKYVVTNAGLIKKRV